MDRSKKTLFELIGGIVTLTLIELAIVTILKKIMSNEEFILEYDNYLLNRK